MAKLLVSNYYKQMALIGKNSGRIKDDTVEDTASASITDDTGTFKLIDEMIRDLVKIKNDVKTRRDTKLLDVAIGDGGATSAIIDDVINFEGNDNNYRKQATIWAKKELFGNDDPNVRGVERTNDATASYVPSVYKNEADVYISEGALFHTLRSSAYIIKKLKHGSEAQIKANVVAGAVVANDLLHA